MTKQELIEILKEYKTNKAMLALRIKEKISIEKRLKRKRDSETPITGVVGINNDIHSKNSISDKVAKKVLVNDNKRLEDERRLKELEKEIRDLKEKVEEAEIRLNSLYYKEREILTAYYVDNRTAEDISQNLYFKLFSRTCSPRYIQSIIKENTEKLLNL